MEIRDLELKLRRLELEEKDLILRLENVRRAWKKWKRELNYREYGVKPGVIVVSTGGKNKGVRYRVTSVEASIWKSKPWLKGNKQLKSGKFGTGQYNLFESWEVDDE